MVCQDGRWYLFFEVMNQDSDRGEIGLALSDDGIHWEYSRIVLVEPFTCPTLMSSSGTTITT